MLLLKILFSPNGLLRRGVVDVFGRATITHPARHLRSTFLDLSSHLRWDSPTEMLSSPRWWPPSLLVVMRQFFLKKNFFVCLIAKVNCRLRQLRNGHRALPCFPQNSHIPPRV